MDEDVNNQPNVTPVQPPARPTISAPQTPQPLLVQPTASSPDGQAQVGMSASQMGYNQPKNKLFDVNPKNLVIKGLVILIILGGVFAALVFTHIVVLSELQTMSYTDAKGTHYKLDFYAKHGSKQLNSGNMQLLSKVSKDGKFPLAFSVNTSDGLTAYNRVKDCASLTKVFDVQNSNLKQTISVCDTVGAQNSGQNVSGAVYVAGFTYNNQAHIITIAQDYAGIDLSSQNGAKESLTKFGMEPYQEDIKKIVSSIKVE